MTDIETLAQFTFSPATQKLGEELDRADSNYDSAINRNGIGHLANVPYRERVYAAQTRYDAARDREWTEAGMTV